MAPSDPAGGGATATCSMIHRGPQERFRRKIGAVVATASLLCLAAAEFVVLAVLVPAPSVAYHGTRGDQDAGGGIPLFVIAPIVVVVAVGIVALGVWGRKKPKGKAARRRARKR
jgi:hypothetical protein